MTKDPPMNAESMLALTERCEAASADEQASILVEAWDLLNPSVPSTDERWFDWYQDRAQLTAMLDCGAYESVALLLVPEGVRWQFDSHYNVATAHAYWTPLDAEDSGYALFRAEAATPALSLTAASLRAHAQGSKT